MNWIQQFKQRIERLEDIRHSATQENPQPEGQGESLDPAALRTVDDFLLASSEVSDGVETPADNIYAAYQAFCESRQVGTVNATAFSVRVMNFYRGRGMQRDEVVSDGKLIAMYRGLDPKPPEAETFPTTPEPIAASEREPGEDEAGIDGWRKRVPTARFDKETRGGDFHVFEGLFGVKPISRGFSWRD